jgi:hypothetical protein
VLINLALKMAKEHENRLSLKRKTMMYRQVVKMGSASSWDKFNLDLFQVDYDKNAYDQLPHDVDECAANEKDPILETRIT